jgi:uncharacterized protein
MRGEAMPGKSDLDTLLRNLRPELRPGVFAFCSWPRDRPLADLPAMGTFREAEGMTVIVEERVAAERGLACLYRAAWITLGVHSDLHAVGLLAAATRALADAGISVNVVSAVHHDHLFVPVERTAEAMAVLESLAVG